MLAKDFSTSVLMDEKGIYIRNECLFYSSITDFDHNINIMTEFLHCVERFCHMPWKPIPK